MIYLDFASHNIWNAKPPAKIVSRKITSIDRFFLFCYDMRELFNVLNDEFTKGECFI